MTIKSSGSSLSFGEIAVEFGLPSGKNLGAYRVSQTIGSLQNLPLATGIPGSGEIKFSDFYGKRLNMVVDYFTSSDGDIIQGIARRRYGAGRVVVVGGFRSAPSSTSGTKVIINVNARRSGSAKGNRNNTALRTGNWDSDTNLQLVIGSTGSIYGSGGDGGNGGTGDPTAGSNGTSALGIEYPTTITNYGYIQAGFGGGGGGSYRARDVRINAGKKNAYNEWNVSSGGGGGGGAGYPGGTGGSSGGQQGSKGTEGSAGTNGGLDTKGTGGAGGVEAGAGGDGGQPAATSASKGEDSNVGGAAGGATGYAIIFYNDGSGSSLTNFGTIYGDTAYNTNPT
jgi:hypothetical protein